MNYTTVFGAALPELGWVPAPRYILRRAAILEELGHYPPGRILEIGCGAGALLYDLARRGFSGCCLETSPSARQLASYMLQDATGFRVVRDFKEIAASISQSFDYLMAFEVLEHVEDDQTALKGWTGYLKPGALALISVPSHPEKWNDSDEWAGHYRRYDRQGLVTLLKQAGFNILTVKSYGWPLANLIEPIRSWNYGRQLRQSLAATETANKRFASARSGVERSVETRLYPLYASWPGRKLFSFFIRLQRSGYDTDRGNGYLAVARKIP